MVKVCKESALNLRELTDAKRSSIVSAPGEPLLLENKGPSLYGSVALLLWS